MKKYFSIVILLTGMIFASCNSYLEVTPPNSITNEQIMELLNSGDDAKIDLVLGGLARGLPSTFQLSAIHGTGIADPRHYTVQGLDCMRNLEGNDVVLGAKELGTLFGNDEYKLNDFTGTDNGKNVAYWNAYWANINTANKLLNYLIPEIVGDNPRMLYYRAVALTVHAWFYNYLMENYQDAYTQGGNAKLGMMWYDSWDPTKPPQARLSAQETYAKIAGEIAEAVRAFSELPENERYTASTTDIDLGVAAFVQARVALCMGEWATVISACDKVLAVNNKLMNENQYVNHPVDGEYGANNGFMDNTLNPEVLIGWSQALSTKGGYMIYRNIFGGGQGGYDEGFYRIDKRLYNQINEDDYRKDNFLGEGVTIDGYLFPPAANGRIRDIPDYSNLKFSCMFGIGSSDIATWSNVCDYYMRVSEVYLMKAEAQLKSGNEAGAKATLNTLLAARTRAGATPLTCDNYAVTGKTYTTEQMIQLQTRIEMWGERGLEFYNNKRWNIRVDRAGDETNHTAKATYEVSRMTLAIPKTETDYNPLCVQN